jgi:eukaryotic-like serine/threonine-protein kinase
MRAVIGSGRLIAGRYRLQGPIGRGAMGIVWRGRDELLDRDVAVKEVQITAHASPADAEGIYQRTLREARTAARLSHPSVVTVFDVVEENGNPWIVMELVSARSLDRVIIEAGPLPPLQAAELGASLVSALAAAHASGVLHRDVKPSNVLVTDDGRVVLTDFGIATFAADPSQTQAGMVVGTPGFTAPERVRGNSATPASDLWSLGATLYAAVEGRGPFDRVGGSTAISAGVATEDAPRSPSAGPLAPVIDALLSRDPGTRPDAATAAHLLAEAATAARTGASPLGDGWLAAEASTSEREGMSECDAAARPRDWAHAPEASSVERRAAFLDPPVFGDLSMPQWSGAPAGANGSANTNVANAEAPASAGLAGLGLAAGPARPFGGADALAGAVGAVAASGPQLTSVGTVAAAAPQLSSGSDGKAVLWEPFKRAPGEPADGTAADGSPPGLGGLAGTGGSGSGGSGGDDWSRHRGGAAKPSSGRLRLMVAMAGIVAIAVAAVVGWDIYSHVQNPQALRSPVAGTTSAGGGAAKPGPSGSAGGGNHGAGTMPTPGGSAPTTATRGQSAGKGTPSPAPSAKSSSNPSGPSPTPSSTPTPSPSPSSSTAPVLPPGYVWHSFTAAVMGSTAGLKIGMPSPWRQSITSLVAHLNQPARNFHLTVNLGSWTYAGPLAQAEHLQAKDAKSETGYKEISLGAVGFKAIGGFRAAAAAELKFSWTKPSVGNYTEMVVLVTLTTKSGVQPYTFTLWAPSATFGSAASIFHTALSTFRPLPGASA